MPNVPENANAQQSSVGPNTIGSPSSQPDAEVESSRASAETFPEETSESWETFIEQTSDEPPPTSLKTARSSSLSPHISPSRPKETARQPSETVEPAEVVERKPQDEADPLPKPLPKPPAPPDTPTVAPSTLSPTMRAVFIGVFGLVGFVVIFALLFRFHPVHGDGLRAVAASPMKGAKTAAKPAKTTLKAHTALDALPDFDVVGIRLPGPWRVASLEGKDGIRLAKGQVGKSPLVKTLVRKHVKASQVYRALHALQAYSRAQHPRRRDKFVVAYKAKTKEIIGFELITSPLDIYQAKENDQGLLEGTKLDLKVMHREILAGIRTTDDSVETALTRAHLDPSAAKVIDRAFDRRASMSSMPAGSTLRVILQETMALGRFAKYDFVSAMEYHSSKSKKKPLRIYRFQEGKRYAYLDQRGHEPYRGGWRIPVPGAPITSPFNPKRMHPILHIRRPHNGTDFGARTGTPIHATSFGVIDWAAPRGAAGNLVIIKHPGNIESYYMHMHHFAPGIKKGVKVETFQVIGAVGTTGRSTGPHLHFGIKRNGKWINPMSLKLDGDRLLPAAYRDRFNQERAKWDAKLDAIKLPPEVVPEPEKETVQDAGEEDKQAGDEQAGDKHTGDKRAGDKQADTDDEELEPVGSEDHEPPDDETP